MEKEEILINLKVLHGIEANQKLIARTRFLNVEYTSIVPLAIRRWVRQDNREAMLNKIRLVLNSALKLHDDNDVCQSLRSSIIGLKNLKETYTHCGQTKAQLEVFIDSIESTVRISTSDSDDV
jgi:hypothetical protein